MRTIKSHLLAQTSIGRGCITNEQICAFLYLHVWHIYDSHFFFQFEGGMSHLPLLDPSMRAIPLSPAEWKERLEAVNKTDLRAKDYHDRDFILLDVRNGISSKVPK